MRKKLYRIILFCTIAALMFCIVACQKVEGNGFPSNDLLVEYGFEHIIAPENTSSGTYTEYKTTHIEFRFEMDFESFQSYCSELYKNHQDKDLAFVGHWTKTGGPLWETYYYCIDSEDLPLKGNENVEVPYMIIFSDIGFDESNQLQSAKWIELVYKPKHSVNGANVSIVFRNASLARVYKDTAVKPQIVEPTMSIHLADGTTEIQADSNKEIHVAVLPENNSYEYEYGIEKVILNNGHEVAQENTENYAFLSDDKLYTTDLITVGSKVILRAVIKGQQVSDTLIVDVVKTSIQSAAFYYSTAVPIGEAVMFDFNFYPQNATVNLENLPIIVELLTPELGTLTKIDNRKYVLSVSSNAECAEMDIVIKITEGETVLQYTLYIEPIQINALYLYNHATNEEFARESTVAKEQQIEFYAVVEPADATVIQFSYNYFSTTPNSSIYVDLSDSGVLTINSNAPSGMVLYLSVTAGRNSSAVYKITIE